MIAALQNANIVSELADGSFGANQAITRKQVASMLTVAFNLYDYEYEGTLPFKDIVKHSSAYYTIGPLYENNIIAGVTSDTFGLKETMKSLQLALFIQRIENLEKNRIMQSFKSKDFGANALEMIAVSNWVVVTGSFIVASYKIGGDENYEFIGLNKYQVTITTVGGKL